MACLLVATGLGQAPQSPAAGAGPFAGRWEISVVPPAGQTVPFEGNRIPFFIIELAESGGGLSGKVVDITGAPNVTAKSLEASVKDGQLVMVLDSTMFKFNLKGKRVGDHLEGTVIPEGQTEEAGWVGQSTTKDKLAPPQMAAPSPDQKDLSAAMAKPMAERAGALKQFIADHPASALTEQAEYQIVNTFPGAADRRAAQEAFIAAHPKSSYNNAVYPTLMESYMRDKPVNEAGLNALIDAYVNGTSERPMPSGVYERNLRAGALNTVADRLMVNEVMLDRALELIQKSVALAGDKQEPQSRAMYITTLGQVLYKLKQYDQAERELKRAIEIAGPAGDGEAQLYLGKVYEVRHDDTAALAAYLRAEELASPLDTRASLERLYAKVHGSVDGLNRMLDEKYLARPKPFDPGHYARGASSATPPRVVLAELFTGSECGPCVAADAAFDGLAERYGHDTVAVLVYHLHIPGPDPMTNADTEARAKYYDVRSTPTAVVDGVSPQVGGGGLTQAASVFSSVRGKVESRLEQRPLATLAGFKAKVDGQTITVSGQADLAPAGADKAATATLHVALVQDVVHYAGSNGVRLHNLVVRKLLGSPAGTPLQTPGTKTTFSESVNVTTLGDSLDAYLSNYEKTGSRSASGFTFKDRVDRLDPKQLLIVAFVQDDKTREILQAVFVTPGR
jgi:tetratricopeptide (TPR) repeat protein